MAVGASVRGRSDEDSEWHLSHAMRRGIKKSLGDRHAGAETVSVLARIEGSVVELSLLSSGSPLDRRGYRLASGKAPLQTCRSLSWISLAPLSSFDPLLYFAPPSS